MIQIDIATLVNWIIFAAIGFIFGMAIEQVRYRKEKHLLELQFQHKAEELKQEMQKQEQMQLRSILLEGLDDPDARIGALVELGNKLRVERFSTHAEIVPESYALPILERVIQFLFNPKSTSN